MERLETTVACEAVALAYRLDVAHRRNDDVRVIFANVPQSPDAVSASAIESLRVMRDRGEL